MPLSRLRTFHAVSPRPDEIAAARPGDGVVPAEVVMDRAFDVAAAPEVVWPWLVQLGKGRAGWYLPRPVERFLPRRAARMLVPGWQGLSVGDVVPDYGGAAATFEVRSIEPASSLVYWSRRGRTELTWAIDLTRTRIETGTGTGTRVHLRLRLGPVRHVRLAETVGGFFDLLTIAGMAAGLKERISDQQASQRSQEASGA